MTRGASRRSGAAVAGSARRTQEDCASGLARLDAESFEQSAPSGSGCGCGLERGPNRHHAHSAWCRFLGLIGRALWWLGRCQEPLGAMLLVGLGDIALRCAGTGVHDIAALGGRNLPPDRTSIDAGVAHLGEPQLAVGAG